MPEVNAALSKIQLVGYSQKIVSISRAFLRSILTACCFPAFSLQKPEKCLSFATFLLGPGLRSRYSDLRK